MDSCELWRTRQTYVTVTHFIDEHPSCGQPVLKGTFNTSKKESQRKDCTSWPQWSLIMAYASMWQGSIGLQRGAKETSFLQLWWHPWRKTSTACCNQGSLWWFTPSSWESSHTNEEWAVGWFFCGLGRGGCHPKQSCPTNCCQIVSLIRPHRKTQIVYH